MRLFPHAALLRTMLPVCFAASAVDFELPYTAACLVPIVLRRALYTTTTTRSLHTPAPSTGIVDSYHLSIPTIYVFNRIVL